MLLLSGEEDILHIGLLRFLPEAAFPGIPLPDVWLQIPPALQHGGAAHVCQLRPARVSACGKHSGSNPSLFHCRSMRRGLTGIEC